MHRARTRFGDENPTVRRLHLHALPCADEPARLGRQIRGVNRYARKEGRAHNESKACGERRQAGSRTA